MVRHARGSVTWARQRDGMKGICPCPAWPANRWGRRFTSFQTAIPASPGCIRSPARRRSAWPAPSVCRNDQGSSREGRSRAGGPAGGRIARPCGPSPPGVRLLPPADRELRRPPPDSCRRAAEPASRFRSSQETLACACNWFSPGGGTATPRQCTCSLGSPLQAGFRTRTVACVPAAPVATATGPATFLFFPTRQDQR